MMLPMWVIMVIMVIAAIAVTAMGFVNLVRATITMMTQGGGAGKAIAAAAMFSGSLALMFWAGSMF